MKGRICCFGDSITYGEFVATDEIWPTLLRHRFPEWRVLNRGVCADTTRLGLERFPRDVQQAKPEVLLIQFGHNDANRWMSDGGHPRVSPAAYRANLVEMVNRARLFHVETIVLIAPHVTSHDRLNEWTAPYLAGMRAVSLDTQTVFLEPGKLQVLADGLHLSPAGHQQMAGKVADALAGYLR